MGRAMDALEKKLAIPLNQEGKREMVDSYFRGLTIVMRYGKRGNVCVVPSVTSASMPMIHTKWRSSANASTTIRS